MRVTDRNRIDRPPTRGERWLGGALSALVTLATIPAAIFVLVIMWQRGEVRNTGVVIAMVLGFIGISCAFLFYRICFTEARAASARAQSIYMWISILLGALFTISLIKRQVAEMSVAAPSNTSCMDSCGK